MTDRREGPRFVIDSSGKVWEVRQNRFTPSQPPPSEPPGNGRDGRSGAQPSRRSTGAPYLIPIPIGLILCLVISLLRNCGTSERSAFYPSPSQGDNVFRSKSDYSDFRMGTQAYFLGEYDAAIRYFTEALESEPDVGEVYNRRALAYHEKGEYDRALADYEQALEHQSDPAMVYNNRAITYLDVGELDKARADLGKAIELDPRLGKAYFNRALVHAGLGDYDAAIADLGQALQYPARKSTPSMFDQASSRLEEKLDESDRERLSLLTGMLGASEQEDEFLETGVDPYAVRYHRALAYQANGEYDGALADLDEAIELRPGSSEAYYARSLLHLSRGDLERARADCRAILELSDDPEWRALAEELLATLSEALPE